ncbi:MAG: MCE family protein [Planctomycetes bacterium]|nr:MCE family protein [Planctomycetota bacterium]MCB9888161.1 MCE family protein [Planctomycetota bacterium]
MDRIRYVLGVVTLAVMATGGWYLYRQARPGGDREQYGIEVSFLDGRGLKSGADVHYRGIRVGSVQNVEVDEDGARAIVSLTIRDDARRLVCNNSRFWIVTPRFHGFGGGVSGLETLVRDAYLSFATPVPFGEPVPAGSRLVGEEAPAALRRDVILPPVQRDDLRLQVLLPENHGIAVGARLMYRGMETGEVRELTLAADGSHVVVDMRIAAEFRTTVTDTSVFWVAKPQVNLQFSLSNPVAMHELGALISPFLAYYTVPNGPKRGAPVPDGYRVAAAADRPAIAISDVPPAALRAKPPSKAPSTSSGIVLVRIVYAAEDVDWLTPNDLLRREGTGVLYLDARGTALVLTCRSVCDAAYYHVEAFGIAPEIKNERIRVQLASGQALPATRLWVAPNGTDLLVLRVDGLPLKHATSRPELFEFVGDAEVGSDGLQVQCTGTDGATREPASLAPTAFDLGATRGGAVLRGGKVVGVAAQRGVKAPKPTVLGLKPLPESLRPKR